MRSISRKAIRVIFAAGLALAICAPAYAAGDTFVVVLDAGHGGKDAGALGRKTKEKDINLKVVLKVGRLIDSRFPDVKVVYTRTTDRFVELQERARIANKAKGDLFISVHTNSIDRKNPNRTSIQGASTYTLGLHRTEENLEVAKRENAVILLEEDFSTRYEGFDPNSTESYIIFELLQGKHMEQSIDFASSVQKEFKRTAGRTDKGVRQGGLLVLRETSMPAVLVELDFICNPTQENFMASESGQEKLARSIFNAFCDYKACHDRKNGQVQRAENTAEVRQRSFSQQTDPESEPAPATENAATARTDKTVYKIQIASSDKPLPAKSPQFKGLAPVSVYRENGLYKYTCFETTVYAEVQRELKRVRTKIPDAFVVRFADGKRLTR